jgi:hypothetical protein
MLYLAIAFGIFMIAVGIAFIGESGKRGTSNKPISHSF